MSQSNPIHFVEVSVNGPDKQFPWTQVTVWVHRANRMGHYMVGQRRHPELIPSFYRLGLLLMSGYLARTVPGSVHREVVYVP